MAGRLKRDLTAIVLAVALGLAPHGLAQGIAGSEDARVSSGPVCEIAGEQVYRYPHMSEADLYKFAHQAAFGPAHAIPDPGSAREWMAQEIAALEAVAPDAPEPPMLEPLLPDGSLVRVHLKPWIEAGRDPEDLLSAFVRTANEYVGSQQVLKVYWACFREFASAGVLPLGVDALDSYLTSRESEGWPAVHHSEAYETAYAPAYRVVWSMYLGEDKQR